MPQNKNATIRYQALDRCFSDFRHRYYIDDLIDAECKTNHLFYILHNDIQACCPPSVMMAVLRQFAVL